MFVLTRRSVAPTRSDHTRVSPWSAPGAAWRGPGPPSRRGASHWRQGAPGGESGHMATTSLPDANFRTVDGVRIRVVDSGDTGLLTVVLTSPWPESLYAFAPIWGALARHARLFAVDL